MEDGWHTYWRTRATRACRRRSRGRCRRDSPPATIQWPAPHALPVGPLVNYGYEGEVLHLVDRHAAAPTLQPGSRATLAARADWLVCKETCIPEGADLDADAAGRRERRRRSAVGRAAIAATRAALPQPLAGWTRRRARRRPEDRADAHAAGRRARSRARCISSRTPKARIEPSAPQTLARGDGGTYVLTLPVSSQLTRRLHERSPAWSPPRTGFGDGARPAKAATIDVPLAGAVVAGTEAEARRRTPALDVRARAARPATLAVAAALAFAFVGGLCST